MLLVWLCWVSFEKIRSPWERSSYCPGFETSRKNGREQQLLHPSAAEHAPSALVLEAWIRVSYPGLLYCCAVNTVSWLHPHERERPFLKTSCNRRDAHWRESTISSVRTPPQAYGLASLAVHGALVTRWPHDQNDPIIARALLSGVGTSLRTSHRSIATAMPACCNSVMLRLTWALTQSLIVKTGRTAAHHMICYRATYFIAGQVVAGSSAAACERW